jgi:DNA-directed RNA polymerase sigma subunit (sigma70/sigma32)
MTPKQQDRIQRHILALIGLARDERVSEIAKSSEMSENEIREMAKFLGIPVVNG